MRLRHLYSFKLRPREPYNFKLTASCYNFKWWFNGEKCILPLSGDPPLMAIAKEIEGEISVEVYGLGNADVEREVKWMLGVDEDLTGFYEVIANDAILREVPRTLRGMRLRSTSLWQALLIAICQQNASFAQGWSMLCRLYKLFGVEVEINGVKSLIPPSPNAFLRGDAEAKLKSARVGYRAETIIKAAVAASQGALDDLAKLKSQDAEAKLKEIKGIGSYTARLALVLAHRRYELLPLDRWLKSLAKEVYKLNNVEEELKRMWGNWCGLAMFFTTVVLDADVLSIALKRALSGDVSPRAQPSRPTPLTLWMHEIC